MVSHSSPVLLAGCVCVREEGLEAIAFHKTKWSVCQSQLVFLEGNSFESTPPVLFQTRASNAIIGAIIQQPAALTFQQLVFEMRCDNLRLQLMEGSKFCRYCMCVFVNFVKSTSSLNAILQGLSNKFGFTFHTLPTFVFKIEPKLSFDPP